MRIYTDRGLIRKTNLLTLHETKNKNKKKSNEDEESNIDELYQLLRFVSRHAQQFPNNATDPWTGTDHSRPSEAADGADYERKYCSYQVLPTLQSKYSVPARWRILFGEVPICSTEY
jgi:hypothetical protein